MGLKWIDLEPLTKEDLLQQHFENALRQAVQMALTNNGTATTTATITMTTVAIIIPSTATHFFDEGYHCDYDYDYDDSTTTTTTTTPNSSSPTPTESTAATTTATMKCEVNLQPYESLLQTVRDPCANPCRCLEVKTGPGQHGLS